MLILIATLIGFILLAASLLLTGTIYSLRSTNATVSDVPDFDYGPMRRLLDPAECQYLLKNGVSKDVIKSMRKSRRKLYRLYLRTLVQDFDRITNGLKLVQVSSYTNRPDLATFLMRQKVMFYRNVLLAEFSLALHTSGFECVPQVDLLGPLEMLRAQLRQLIPATVTATSAV